MATKRTYTIAEAAELTGLTRKAVARRVERGSLRSLVRHGRRLIPRSELVRAGLLREDGSPEEPTLAPSAGAPATGNGPSPEAVLAALMRELLDRLERQGNEIASYRAITQQAESLHLEREIGELRARLVSLESQQGGAPARPRPDAATQPGRPADETILLGAQPAPQPGSEHPIWLPPSAASPAAPQPAARPPVPQRPAPYQPRPARHFPARILVLLLEAVFIVAVAVAAWYAELQPAVIVGTIGAAWLIVALLEWIRWSTRRTR